MSNQIVIDSGFKTYEVVNERKELIGKISFNPSDANIVHRYQEVVEDLEKLDFNFETENTEEFAEKMNQLERVVFEKIDYLVNAEIAETFFSIMGPFSPLASGQFFVESVINAIGQAITQETGRRVKRINQKIQKHTGKYRHG